MADKYTKKSGDDGNTGADYANGYLTIQKNVDEVGSGDNSYVGFGEYAENIVFPATKPITLIFDRSTFLKATTGYVFAASDLVYAKNIYNANIESGSLVQSTTRAMIPNFYNSEIHAPINLDPRGGSSTYFYAENSIFTNTFQFLQTYSYQGFHRHINSWFLGSTFYVRYQLAPGNYYAVNCGYKNLQLAGTGTTVWTDHTWLFEHCALPSTIYLQGVATSFADAVANYPSVFVNCFEVADITTFLDSNYCPIPGSPFIDNGKGGIYANYVGARKPANNYNIASELFVGATYSSTEFSTLYGGVVLSSGATTGTVTTNVLRLGAAQTIRELFLDLQQSIPTDVVDYDKTDVPNRPTFRYRSSLVSEAACLAASWTECENWEDINEDWDWFQLEFTLRNDGVAA